MNRALSLALGLTVAGALAGTAAPAEAVRVGSGAPGYVGVVNQVRATIKVSGHNLAFGHTRFHVDSDTITIKSPKRWKIGALGGGSYTGCQSANKTTKIIVRKNNTGAAHQFVVKPC